MQTTEKFTIDLIMDKQYFVKPSCENDNNITSCTKIKPKMWQVMVEQGKQRMHEPVYNLGLKMLQFALHYVLESVKKKSESDTTTKPHSVVV